jgi:phage repressor protein C with HTH and peptisase S24 domain
MPKASKASSTPPPAFHQPMFPPPKRRPNPPVRPLVDVDTFPDVYSLCLEGDCLEPLIPDGAAVVIKKSEPYTVGGRESCRTAGRRIAKG